MFMDVFSQHMPLVHGIRFKVSWEIMNDIVNQLCLRTRPITWGIMTHIIDEFLVHVRTVLDTLIVDLGPALDRRNQLDAQAREMQRAAFVFRSTCRLFWWDQAP